MESAEALERYYSHPSPYKTAWEQFVAQHPDSKLLQPIENKGHTIMSWTDVDLVGVSTEMALVPEGSYVWGLLPGAKYSQWDNQKIELGAKVLEGKFAGRVIYFSYGNPDKSPSMVQAFKRLEVALAKNTGVAIAEGEDPIEYLNNPEVVGGKFIAPVRHRTLPATDERAETTKQDISVFKVKAVPVA